MKNAMRSNSAMSLSLKDERVLTALTTLHKELSGDINKNTKCSKFAIKTREVADKADMNIYNCRYSLIKLTRLGMISPCVCQSKKNSCWLPAP